MGLPEGSLKLAWPPKEYTAMLAVIAEWALWYCGNPASLATYYSRVVSALPGTRFWRRVSAGGVSSAIHVPIASDIAAVSSFMLFGEAPRIRIPELDADKVPEGAEKAQKRLDELLDLTNFRAKCVEGANLCSGLGGVFMKLDKDPEVAEYPLLSVVLPTQALPVFRWGRLSSVTFWQTIAEDSRAVYRHLEQHTREGVYHGVYKGTKTYLGVPIDLDSFEVTKGLLEFIPSDDGQLNVVYVPNSLPNLAALGGDFGQADTAGAITLMEFLDETFTSWQRDVRLGQSRMLIPQEYLTVDPLAAAGSKLSFDVYRELFTPLQVDAAVDQGGNKMVAFQPDIRHEAHYKTSCETIARIVSNAGYAVQTFGEGEGTSSSSTSAAALKVRERKSLMTKGKKEGYWGMAIEYLAWRLQVMDGKEEAFRPTASFGDSYAPDLLELAQTVEFLNRAVAASTEAKVKLLHQEWEQEEVDKEVEKIDGKQASLAQPQGLEDLSPDSKDQMAKRQQRMMTQKKEPNANA